MPWLASAGGWRSGVARTLVSRASGCPSSSQAIDRPANQHSLNSSVAFTPLTRSAAHQGRLSLRSSGCWSPTSCTTVTFQAQTPTPPTLHPIPSIFVLGPQPLFFPPLHSGLGSGVPFVSESQLLDGSPPEPGPGPHLCAPPVYAQARPRRPRGLRALEPLSFQL